MAVRAIVTFIGFLPGSASVHDFEPNCEITILGSNIGDFVTPTQTYLVSDYNPNETGANLNAAIAQEIKDYLLVNNVPFGESNSDTIRITNPLA